MSILNTLRASVRLLQENSAPVVSEVRVSYEDFRTLLSELTPAPLPRWRLPPWVELIIEGERIRITREP